MAELKVVRIGVENNGTPVGDFQTLNLVNPTSVVPAGETVNITFPAGGGGGAVNSVGAGTGLVNNGTATDPVLDVVAADATIAVAADSIAAGVMQTANLADESVTLAKLAHVGTDVFLGRDTAGIGDVETLTPAVARTMLNVADGAAANQTITAGTGLTGGGSGAAVTLDVAAADATITVAADSIAVGTIGTGNVADEAITLPKLAHIATDVFLGRTTAGTGDVETLGAAAARTVLNVEDGADVTDTANVTAAGAVMDSELASETGIKTLNVPDSTTVSAFGATLVDDLDAATARTTLGVDAAGTDNSTDVTLAGALDYLTIVGQVITRNAIDLATDVTGELPTANLADDAVTLAKLASGTAGNLIAYDASGNPAAVATGTSGHVLTSNGAGAAPTFQAAPGGGGGGDVSGPGVSVTDNAIAVWVGTTGTDIEEADILVGASGDAAPTHAANAVLTGGRIANSGTISTTGDNAIALGSVEQIGGVGSATLTAAANAFAFGRAQSASNASASALTDALAAGAVVLGDTTCSTAGLALLRAAGSGSLAQGRASGAGSTVQASSAASLARGISQNAGTIEAVSSSNGAFVSGFADAGILRATGAQGGFASGSAEHTGCEISAQAAGAVALGRAADGGFSGSGDIIASGAGALAGGQSAGFGAATTISATQPGAFAWGSVNGFGGAPTACSATQTNAVQFGPGTNNVANSLQVGDTTDGLRLLAGGTTSTVNGSIWVNGSGQVVIRSGGSDVVIT